MDWRHGRRVLAAPEARDGGRAHRHQEPGRRRLIDPSPVAGARARCPPGAVGHTAAPGGARTASLGACVVRAVVQAHRSPSVSPPPRSRPSSNPCRLSLGPPHDPSATSVPDTIGVRYGLKVYANDLNPVSALALKATIGYPAQHGRTLLPMLNRLSSEVAEQAGGRQPFFHHEAPEEWWPAYAAEVRQKFRARTIVNHEPAGNERIQATLWLRTVPCSKCELKIPISTNFLIVSKKGKPEASLAAFPVVPAYGQSNECTFRIVPRVEWQDCLWPRPGFERWDPRETPTFRTGGPCVRAVDRLLMATT